MPLLLDELKHNTGTYKPKLFFQNGHLNTILTNRLRKVENVQYTRKRCDTWDDDFIDFDYSKVGSKKAVLIFHGLEGNSKRQYAKGMVRIFNENGYDAVVMNHRGCSGELNKLPTAYHSGKTDDVHFGVETVITDYEEVVLVGFSLGGNMMLKYLGDNKHPISDKIKNAIGISVPVHLKDSATQLAKKSNTIYMKRFLKTLKHKTLQKATQFQDLKITEEQILNCKSFIDYDNLYTAPVHGFKDAEDYWEQCSSKQFLQHIQIPTLLVNALDDPFLGENCYPTGIAKTNNSLTVITPKYGGHVGFGTSFQLDKPLWTEKLSIEFTMASK